MISSNKRAQEHGEPFHPFDIATDYKHYVDGKLRYDGVHCFLGSFPDKLVPEEPWKNSQ